MQRNGGAGPRHTAPNGSSANGGSTNGGSITNGGSTTNGHGRSAGRSVSPRKPTKSRSPARSRNGSNPGVSPRRPQHHHHRVSLEEGLELSREPWRQDKDKFGRGSGWAATEEENGGVAMGGASSSRGGSKGYAEVDRDEPLLGEGARGGEPKQPQDERCVFLLCLCVRLGACGFFIDRAGRLTDGGMPAAAWQNNIHETYI